MNQKLMSLNELKKMLPEMFMARQVVEVEPALDLRAGLKPELKKLSNSDVIKPGMHIAVGVGSRGIDKLVEVVTQVVDFLKQKGANPFVVPAMGSHGNASADGQIHVLRLRGITEKSTGTPVRASMETIDLGKTDCGIPLFIDRLTHEADGYVLINRIKPHTNFVGPTESGILKMAAIGIGNQLGAEHYHRLSLVRPQYEIVSTAGREVIERTNFLFGVGLVENQHHKLCELKIGLKTEMEEIEVQLLKKARSYMLLLPVKELDLLIIDEMGKEISGMGIDPNIVGRDCLHYGVARHSPKITRIFVRDLTEATAGATVSIAQADFTLTQLIDKIDMHATAVNCLTSCAPEAAKLPLAYATDLEALSIALKTVRPCTKNELKLAYIKNTMELEYVFLSRSLRPEIQGENGIEEVPFLPELQFNSAGMLLSPFSADEKLRRYSDEN